MDGLQVHAPFLSHVLVPALGLWRLCEVQKICSPFCLPHPPTHPVPRLMICLLLSSLSILRHFMSTSSSTEGRLPCECCVSLLYFILTSSYTSENRSGRGFRNGLHLTKTTPPPPRVLLLQQKISSWFVCLHVYLFTIFGHTFQ